jgi:hypothetical protein
LSHYQSHLLFCCHAHHMKLPRPFLRKYAARVLPSFKSSRQGSKK